MKRQEKGSASEEGRQVRTIEMKPELAINVSHNYLQAQVITRDLMILLMSKYGHVFVKANTKAVSSESPVIESA